MAIQIGAKPDSGFDDPLGMLKDCHRRIEKFLDILIVVAERAEDRGLTEEEKTAVEAALQYFRSGGQRHTADEECSLFPRLRTGTLPPPAELEALEADHRESGELHDSVEALYTGWAATGELSAADRHRMLVETRKLRHLYARHIQIEETVVFPHAARALDSRTVAEIGLEFKARRR